MGATKSPLLPPPFLSASPRPHPRVAFLGLRPRRVPLLATTAPDATPAPDADATNPLRTLWRRTLQPLGDYGFGKRSVWEGGVGLFMVSGAALLALALAWLRGFQLRSRFRKYNTVFEFTQACGICVGTPVRIRGVTVGSVVRVDSSLRSIDALVEVPLLLLLYDSSFLHSSSLLNTIAKSTCGRSKMITSSYRAIHWSRSISPVF
jgi:hypothetical protein